MSNYRTQAKIIWCPGCGNFGILAALENAFKELNLNPNQVAAVYGIGCHSHMANYLRVYNFEGIHGRALPVAAGIKIANRKLKVITIVGDGDQLGEGANHLVHASKRNSDITCLIHNNQIYSLTVGQASPTSEKGMKTKTTPQGVVDQQLNPLALAIASGATFVARSFSGDIPHLTKILIEAINHKGFALVDILQPCTTLNHTNTFAWYRERIYNINDISGNSARYNLEETGYLPNNKNLAFAKTQEWGEKIPTGIFYKEERLTLENQLLSKDTVLADQPLELSIEKLLAEFN